MSVFRSELNPVDFLDRAASQRSGLGVVYTNISWRIVGWAQAHFFIGWHYFRSDGKPDGGP